MSQIVDMGSHPMAGPPVGVTPVTINVWENPDGSLRFSCAFNGHDMVSPPAVLAAVMMIQIREMLSAEVGADNVTFQAARAH